jgi:endonuclease I
MKTSVLLFSVLLAVSVVMGCSIAPETVGVAEDQQEVDRAAAFKEDFNLPSAVRNYYRSAYGKSGSALKLELRKIISAGYVQKSYDYLWTTYKTSDKTSSGKIWDLYSNYTLNGTGSSAAYWFTPGTHQCGTYKAEAGCYNREHHIPQSTFGSASPMYSDAHFITATDGYVNAKRSNYPHGIVASASWTSKNGSKLGPGKSTQGYTGTVFEPITAAKGDIARMYFYFCVRYYGNTQCKAWASMNSGAKLKTWAQTVYRSWSSMDKVSTKEKNRNNAIYAIQKNRNPFIDYPVLATLIDFAN